MEMNIVGQKLDEITMKLDGMTDAITGLGNIIQKNTQDLGEMMTKLTAIIEKYTDTITERSKQGFDESRANLMEVSKEIGTLRSVTGIDQIMRFNNAIKQILMLLEKTIDPNAIQRQLVEISQFMRSVGGMK